MILRKSISFISAVVLTAFSVFGNLSLVSGEECHCSTSNVDNDICCCTMPAVPTEPITDGCCSKDKEKPLDSTGCHCSDCVCQISQGPETDRADPETLLPPPSNENSLIDISVVDLSFSTEEPDDDYPLWDPPQVSEEGRDFYVTRRGPPC